MNKSNYYELNLVEGNDLFNPLVTDVPNYEIIDEVMHEIETRSIGLANHILGGNIHEITRVNEDTSAFRFVATAPYTNGELFEVDGVQVLGLTPNGKSLNTGDFVIGSNVLCVLTGNTLTIYTSSGSVALAEDSEKLGGEEPSYYGTAQDVSNAISTANASSVIAQNANTNANEALSAISTINSRWIKHLYHNSNPSERHRAGTTITMPQNNCNLYVYAIANSSANHQGNISYTLFGTVGQRLYLWQPTNTAQSKIFLIQENGSLLVETSDYDYLGVVIDVYGITI